MLQIFNNITIYLLKSFNFLQSLVYNKEMEKEEFEEIIERTLENIPEKFKNQLDNLSIVVEENELRYTRSQGNAKDRLVSWPLPGFANY